MADASFILDLVQSKGLVSGEQVKAVRESLTHRGDAALLDSLVEKGFLDRPTMVEILAEEFSMSHVDLTRIQLPSDPADMMSLEIAQRFKSFPVGIENGTLQVAISDPLDVDR